MASTVTSGLRNALHEPVVTGTLLYILTRGPPHIRERLLRPFRSNVLANNGAAKIASLILFLRVLTGVGVVRRISQALDKLSWNNWTLGRPGSQFRFGPSKEELVVITGGSSGFGYEMVKGFSKYARIVVLDIQAFPSELAELPDVHFYQCDLADTPAVEKLCGEIVRKHGDATVLVNNAGIGIGKTVLEPSNGESDKLFKVNLISHLVLIREFLPGMLEKKRGHIVTVASMASFHAAPGLVDYCCSKVGALFVSEGIRAELLTRYPGGEGICTTSIHPSWHATGILNGGVKALAKYGIVPDPASNVSDVVVEQVLKGRSGRVCVPKKENKTMGLRNWPRWAQDVTYGLVWQNEKAYAFGKENSKYGKKQGA